MRGLISGRLLAFAFANAIAAAQSGVGVQNQIFTVPPSWTRTDAPPGVILSPNAAPNLVTLFLVGRPLAGQTLRAAFEQDVRGLSQGLRTASSAPIQTRNANGIELLSVVLELRDSKDIASYRQYLAAGPPGRIEMMIYSAPTPQLFQQYYPGVTAFLANWSFANVAAQTPALPSRAPGRFDAIYSGLRVSSPTRFGVNTDTYTFLEDGTVCHCLPGNGLLGFNSAEELRKSSEFVGQYRVEGDQITILLANGTYRRAGTLMKDRVVIDGRPYELRGDPGQLGAHPLEGVFLRADRSSPDSARRFIRFARNGQFQDQGIVESVTGVTIINGHPVMERAAGAGVYEVSRYTLTLRYSDGYVRRLPIMAEPSELTKPRLTAVSLNGNGLISQ